MGDQTLFLMPQRFQLVYRIDSEINLKVGCWLKQFDRIASGFGNAVNDAQHCGLWHSFSRFGREGSEVEEAEKQLLKAFTSTLAVELNYYPLQLVDIFARLFGFDRKPPPRGRIYEWCRTSP